MRIWVLATMAVLAANGAWGQSAPEMEHGFVPSQAAAYITDVQQQLTTRGYYAGMVDGRMNPALRTAISVYQSDVGLRVTGVPDLAVVNMLKFGPEVKATIQPLGSQPEPKRLSASPAPPPRTAGVPPYEAPTPYRYPEPATEPAADDACVKPQRQAEEPPLPKAAPQHRVISSPLPRG
ncbi:MAG: peptidoglycan-binding protein [Rhodospirillaceae bacterium]|nr:peptidoglycan-binding protein [Rhodospirillales bacterium]